MRVAVVRCRKLPNFVTWDIPYVEDLFTDDRLLIAAFAERGVEARSVVWSDPDVDWNQFDLALIRSTWDYIDERERFLSVLSEIDASSCRLFNPLEAVRWNSDKSYLFDLQEAFVQQGWQSAVVKPTVGAGASDVRRVPSHEVARTLRQLKEDRAQQAFLVQPLVESVVSEGEWSFVYIDGQLSHVLRKKPAPGDYRAHGIYGGTIELTEPLRDDLLQAAAMLAKLPFDLLYARLDLVRMDGHLAVLELELIEPILYFNLAPQGVGSLISATLSRLGQPQR